MSNPIDSLNPADPGDEMQRNVRYQHAYGVVLLLGAASGKLAYKAVWCEQQEDLLGEVDGNIFDGYQVKTRQSELGCWETIDEGFAKSIRRFCELNVQFPGAFRHFAFVSNTACSNSNAKQKKKRAPVLLVQDVSKSACLNDLRGESREGLAELANKIEQTEAVLFAVLKKTLLMVGPSRDAFVAELAQNHVPQFKELANLSAGRLQEVVSELIDYVARASALSSQDPARHYMSLAAVKASDPQLAAKRIEIAEFVLKCREYRMPLFKYLGELTCNPLLIDTREMTRFHRKLEAGGLVEFAGNLHGQALSAHAVLLEVVTRGNGNDLVVQVENVVRNECSEAQLRAIQKGVPYGATMLVDVQDRLKKVASEKPEIAGKVAYETLMGMAGLLTEDCTVWWSDRFELERE